MIFCGRTVAGSIILFTLLGLNTALNALEKLKQLGYPILDKNYKSAGKNIRQRFHIQDYIVSTRK